MSTRHVSYPKHLFCLAAGFATLLLGASTATAAGNPVAPVLVPYTVTAIAGNNQSSIPGYGGEGQPGLSATLNGPNALAVDSVGNVYIADQSNALIRELNAQTGVLKTIAGVPPTKCTGTTCTTTNPGCADGVPAAGNPVGSRVQGLVVDGYGNVYFSDYNYQGVWVIYHGGVQPAKFIALVDAATVSSAGGVKPGYVYHIAGLAVPKAGGGCTGTIGSADQVLATSGSFHDPLQMGIDAAGNLYVQDYANNVVRVINTQATTQKFFGVSVQPGYVAAIVGCNKPLTTACPTSNVPFGSPAGTVLYSSVLVNMTTDQFGNVYETDGKGANGGIYAGVAYAGGGALANLINVETPGLTANPGGWYQVINSITSTYGLPSAVQAVAANGSNNIVLRPTSIAVDPLGNLYMMDYHWIAIYRVDVNSGMATRINGLSGTIAGTNAAPTYCSGTSGPQATDAYGDGCGIAQAKFNAGGTGYVTFDGAGNLYVADSGNNIVRKISVGTQFPATAVGTPLSQILQVHFDAGNLPATSGSAPNFSTGAFKIGSGANDFSIANTTCSNYTTGLDTSLECYVTVTFNPANTGARGASLQATTANGSTYSFTLTGFGSGPHLAIDGGTPTTLAVNGLGGVTAVATDAAGNVYVADPSNNRVVKSAAGSGVQSTVGTGLSGPRGVATDPAGNVYISDTGNGRVVKVAVASGAQTVLSTDLSGPRGLAVDTIGNVYVADTGNSRVVEIPAFGELGEATLLAGASGAQPLSNPVAVAVDKSGNVYVADSSNLSGIIQIVAGGGDLQTVPGGAALSPAANLIGFGNGFVSSPNGIAIDGAGDLYVSDGASNNVQEFPAASGPGSEAFALNLPGLNSPGGIALDPSGNVYVADTGNMRVLVENRSQVAVNFGTAAQFQAAATVPLTVSNIGTTPIAPTIPFVQIAGATANFGETDTCGAANFSSGTLVSGLHCSLTASFKPVANGPLAGTASVQGGAAQLNLTGVGENPFVSISMAVTSPASGPVYGSPATITLTATQPNGSSVPTGSVTFSYTINGVAQPPVTQTLSPNGSGGATTNLNLSNLLVARTYVINAVYNGDANNSVTNAPPLTFTVPGLPIQVVASSVAYTYGGAVPALTGTVTGILPADQAAITVTFTSAATPSSPVGNYPIVAVLSGGNSANYTVPAAVTPSGAPAVVTENPAPLTVVVPSYTAVYGASNITYNPTQLAVGLVNGDMPTYKFTPPFSSLVPVGTYPIVPTLSIKSGSYDKINNYKLSITNGTLTITQANSALAIAAPSAVLPTALSTATIGITAQTVGGLAGTPTGTVTIQDVFTPLTATGLGTPVTAPNVVLTLNFGRASYTPTNQTLGVHAYTFSYSGDGNFIATNTNFTPTNLTVDVADFTIVSTTTPIQVAPGVTPGGVATAPGEQAATPEIANVYIAPVLGSTQVVNLTCAVPASYFTCTLTPSTVTLSGTTTQVSVVAVSVPGTLPVNYTGEVRQGGRGIAFAAIPAALLAMLPLWVRRRRAMLPRLLLLLLAVAVLADATGCGGGNNVKFFTPVPAGPAQVTVTGTSGGISRSFAVPIDVQ